MSAFLPINTKIDQDSRWQVVAQGPDHHHELAGEVVRPPLHGVPPPCLQGQGDEADDGVRNSEVEHQEVHICTASEKTQLWMSKKGKLLVRNKIENITNNENS